MGTKINSNYSDLITFTRASGGHALRPVSYGDELVTNGDFSSTDLSGWEIYTDAAGDAEINVVNGELIFTASDTHNLRYALTGLTAGTLYRVEHDVVSAGWTELKISENSDGSGTITSLVTVTSEDNVAYFTATSSTNYFIGRRNGSTTVGLDNVSVKEVLFDQPDGTLTLFEHPTNIPRVEYDADGNRLGLLVEEARTNLTTYSDFSTPPATRANTTVVDAEPILGLKALNVTTDTGASNDGVVQAAGTSFTSGTTYVCSVFVRIPEGKTARLQNTIGLTMSVDSDGVVFSSSSYGNFAGSSITTNVVSYGNNIFRLSISGTATTSGTGAIWAGPSNAAVAGDSCDVAGWMTETGSFPTSYIKTTGSTATRSADVASIPVADFGYNQSAGTLVVEASHFDTDSGTSQIVYLGDNTQDYVSVYTQYGNYYRVNSEGNDVPSGNIVLNTGGSLSDISKVATSWKNDSSFDAARDGTLGTGYTDFNALSTVPTNVYFGTRNSSISPLNGHIKSIKYYPRRLTNAQLQDITS